MNILVSMKYMVRVNVYIQSLLNHDGFNQTFFSFLMVSLPENFDSQYFSLSTLHISFCCFVISTDSGEKLPIHHGSHVYDK